MDALKLLEEKLVSLAELIKVLKTENAKLAEENAQLAAKLLVLQNSLQDDSEKIDAYKHEKELALLAVDDLIKSIDSLVESQS
jgi:regulator of replication initiation timing